MNDFTITFCQAFFSSFTQCGLAIIRSINPDVTEDMQEKEVLIRLINAKTPDGSPYFDLKKVAQECKGLLAFSNEELEYEINKEEYNNLSLGADFIEDVREILREVKLRSEWQLGIAQGPIVEQLVIRLPEEES